jgi:hypothetical protein
MRRWSLLALFVALLGVVVAASPGGADPAGGPNVTADEMIVHKSERLHRGVRGRGTDEAKAHLAQRFGHRP